MDVPQSVVNAVAIDEVKSVNNDVAVHLLKPRSLTSKQYQGLEKFAMDHKYKCEIPRRPMLSTSKDKNIAKKKHLEARLMGFDKRFGNWARGLSIHLSNLPL